MTGPTEAFRSPRGTHDILPPHSARWERFVALFASVVERAGYGLLHSPMFEHLGVFQRIGEGTDVVRKEMYTFTDQSGETFALRPEGTAPVVRAFVQHQPPSPWKIWYVTPAFRHERPQKGRVRQHHQVGIEALGPADPDLDVEVIALLWDFLAALGLRQVQVLVNSMGEMEGRSRYIERLRAYLRDRAGELDAEDRHKIETFPMRVLDSKREATRHAMRDAPTLLETLSARDQARFERVQQGLKSLQIPFEVEPRLVRGLDYYTHTTFEMKSGALDAAQDTIGGGGRYDALAEALGGDPTGGIGFGCGIERTLLACDFEGAFPAPEVGVQVFVVDVSGGEAARDLTFELRRAGIAADRAWDGRSMKAQMRAADRSGAQVALIVGESELEAGTVTVRELRGGGQQVTVARSSALDQVRALLGQG